MRLSSVSIALLIGLTLIVSVATFISDVGTKTGTSDIEDFDGFVALQNRTEKAMDATVKSQENVSTRYDERYEDNIFRRAGAFIDKSFRTATTAVVGAATVSVGAVSLYTETFNILGSTSVGGLTIPSIIKTMITIAVIFSIVAAGVSIWMKWKV